MVPGGEVMIPGEEVMVPGGEVIIPGEEVMVPGGEATVPGRKEMLPNRMRWLSARDGSRHRNDGSGYDSDGSTRKMNNTPQEEGEGSSRGSVHLTAVEEANTRARQPAVLGRSKGLDDHPGEQDTRGISKGCRRFKGNI